MKQLIDTLSSQDPRGRLVEVFQFQGTHWEVTTCALDGRLHQAPAGERQSILIAAKSAWIAHTFVNCHVYTLQPHKITSLGYAWLAPDIDRCWTPAEYEYPLVTSDSEQNDESGQGSEEAEENEPCS
jgi:hypothetical protein